jgi:hypothetical protein
MKFTVEHPSRKADAQYVRSLAQVTNVVVTKLMDQQFRVPKSPLSRTIGNPLQEPGTGDKSEAAGSSLVVPGARQLEQRTREVHPSGSQTSYPRLTVHEMLRKQKKKSFAKTHA